MKALLDWLDHRTGCRRLAREALYENIPGGARWRYVWGSTLAFAFAVQMITGLFLWMHYSPSATTAWESVYFIQHEMWGGWLLRGIHHYTAQVMIVLVALHMLQVIVDGAYRAPREINFWFGLLLVLLFLRKILSKNLSLSNDLCSAARCIQLRGMGLGIPAVWDKSCRMVMSGE